MTRVVFFKKFFAANFSSVLVRVKAKEELCGILPPGGIENERGKAGLADDLFLIFSQA